MTPLTDLELSKLENFIGYGKINAEVYFFGLEEGGGGYENISNRLRLDKYETVDCRDFHLDILNIQSFHTRKENTDNIKVQRVWGMMSYLMLLNEGKNKFQILDQNRTLIRNYQNNKLGSNSSAGNTLLTELFPLPCTNWNTWGTKAESYEKIILQYKNKNEYKEKVIGKRLRLFNDLFNSSDFNAKAIVCYGKSSWPEFISFFKKLDVVFEDKGSTNRLKVGILKNRTKVILTPFFGNGQMSYDLLDEVHGFFEPKK